MEAINLSNRLLTIAKYVPHGKRVADIGSDHALLPSYLVQEGISSFVIAGELNKGPFNAAKKQVSSLGLMGKIQVKKGDGLSVIEMGEVEIITIAGMGGALITDILEKGKNKLVKIEMLILQPNVGSEFIRKWLDENNWNIIAEEILEEDDKIYEVIVTEPRTGELDPAYLSTKRPKEDLYRIGPILWTNKPSILYKKWKIELDKNRYILNQLEKSNNKKAKEDKQEKVKKEILWVTEVLMCLEKGKV